MLVLCRHRFEEVFITLPDGRRVTVSVVEIMNDKVRLGFEADIDIAIHRREVAESIDRDGAKKRRHVIDEDVIDEMDWATKVLEDNKEQLQ